MITPFDMLYKWIWELTEVEWLPFLITGIIIVLCTILVSHLVSKCIRKFLTKESIPLPSMSIYINIARIFVWAIGLSILLSTCFGIDATGLIAALGVGGIAISLGFKDTIANLISGIEITACKIMKPGDHVMISNHTGTVIDTTWRHTTIKNMKGELIILPNSVINSSAIVKLNPYSVIIINIQLHCKSEALTDVSNKIINEVNEVAKKFGDLAEDIKIKFSSIADGGAKGVVLVKYKKDMDSATTVDIKDSIIKSIAPYVEAAKE